MTKVREVVAVVRSTVTDENVAKYHELQRETLAEWFAQHPEVNPVGEVSAVQERIEVSDTVDAENRPAGPGYIVRIATRQEYEI